MRFVDGRVTKGMDGKARINRRWRVYSINLHTILRIDVVEESKSRAVDEAGDELHPRLGNGTQFAELRGANPEMSRWFQEALLEDCAGYRRLLALKVGD